MTLRTVQDASGLAGTQITSFTPTASDTLPGGQCVKIVVNNGNAASCVVTLVTPETVEGSLSVLDRIVTIPTTQVWEIPVPSRYNDPVTGLATITFSVQTTVSVTATRGNAAP